MAKRAFLFDVLADYARIVELLSKHGPNLKFPIYARSAMACLNCDRAAAQALAERFTAFSLVNVSSCCMPSSSNHSKRRTVKSSSHANA